ncbi:MocR-like pyridoxine biosynthesis transcription factor PdxR [Erwinia tasmaniensis]|uniref:Regulatory protein GntR n=1 Tax=Erwinia tasmaniensis (strain DSM 17950 / CFBP 7177 / CIP 109463 / NCPPB 4357 / Et1/99) TaxID=465817 RepID=B2VIZ0_ERWT9|nr:aminotransferase class I/II-fold pyridoxal phosphate-dependent enzyme [Erwinia tasmaniensis]CAO96209.1 Regulatory protein GntR [Erwinia tasmaniensis Et1/99]
MALTTVPFLALFNSQPAATLRDRVCAMLRQAIANGILPAETRLPSSRLLACDLSLSRVTIEAAYSQLESEGYLSRYSGKGTFVALFPERAVRRSLPTPVPVLSARGQNIIAAGGCDDPPFPRAFAAGSPDLRAFPQRLWRRLTQQRLSAGGESLMGYGDPLGLPSLRQAVAHYLGQSRGVRCTADQVVIVTSSQQALQMIALLLCDRGDRVWLEDPGYRGAYHAFHSNGADVCTLATDEQGAIIGDDAPPRLVYLTPSHQYPTGSTLSGQRRLAWLDFARRSECWLIEDDYDSEFHYDGRPLPALQGLEERARVLYVGTFSKVLFPSLRLAYLVVPDALIEPLRRLRSLMDGHSAQLMQAVTADFIQHGHFAAHLRLMRQLYASRRNLLIDELNNKLAHRLSLFPHQGGLQLTVALRAGGERRLTQQALQHELLLPRLSPLYRQQPAQEGWMLGFSALQPAELIAAVNKLARLSY